jgi:Tol biopolymer transport system component
VTRHGAHDAHLAAGAILFEMIAGRRAFEDATVVETLNAILRTDPPLELLDARANVPKPVVDVIRRCLQKRKTERFASANDAAAALRTARTGMAERPADPVARLDSWKEIAAYLGRGVRTVQRWEREERLPVHRLPHAKRGSVYAHRDELARWWAARGATLAPRPSPPSLPEPPAARSGAIPPLERVTSMSAVTFSPSLSSDGRLVVFVSDGGESARAPQLWLQQIGGAVMRLTADMKECADPAFSANDTHVLFTAKGDSTLNIYDIPTFGGTPLVVKRNATAVRRSPDGRWLAYISLDSGRLHLQSQDGDDRAIAPSLSRASCVAWSPDSQHLLVQARPDSAFEPDYWIVPADGRAPVNTRIVERVRGRGTVLDAPPAWVRDSVVYAAAGREGVLLWRQRLTAEPFQISGEPEPLTRGTEWATFPAASAGRIAFVSGQPDMNLWSMPVDPESRRTVGAPQLVTRGPGVMGHLATGAGGRLVAYFSTRVGKPDVYLRDLESGAETVPAAESAFMVRGFPAISPDGTQLAHGTLTPGPRATRPLFVVDLRSGASRRLSEDCGGRPRQWVGEREILIETFGSSLSSILVLDAGTGETRELLAAPDRSVMNARVSPDGRWIAFDAATPGGFPAVWATPLHAGATSPESDWVLVAESASHPFWSEDSRCLYYLPLVPTRDLRNRIDGRRFDPSSGTPNGEPFVAATLKDAVIATIIAGAAPVIARDRMCFILSDFRGDVWVMDWV